ncbi:hypothetical protein [Paenibacillus lutimineralis]|uniref:hypothetical protein n=1 Tax=Paenibacillus lutimineralis TaxID=2707005 RepID=UPI0013A63D32|nr:hypothetical protein [Paenibacillus lutimineralis]
MEKQLKEELGEKGCCFSISYGAYTPELLEAGKPNFSGEQMLKKLEKLQKAHQTSK